MEELMIQVNKGHKKSNLRYRLPGPAEVFTNSCKHSLQSIAFKINIQNIDDYDNDDDVDIVIQRKWWSQVKSTCLPISNLHEQGGNDNGDDDDNDDNDEDDVDPNEAFDIVIQSCDENKSEIHPSALSVGQTLYSSTTAR